MRTKFVLLVAVLTVGSMPAAQAQKTAMAALTGRVSSDVEGPMEGVLVRAKGEGKTISITVVSDQPGELLFSGKPSHAWQIQHRYPRCWI